MSRQTLYRGRVFLRICGKECRERMLKGVEAKAPSVTLIHYFGLNSSPAEEILDAHGWPRVMRTEDCASAFDAAVASGLPAVLELGVDPEQITPEARLKKN